MWTTGLLIGYAGMSKSQDILHHTKTEHLLRSNLTEETETSERGFTGEALSFAEPPVQPSSQSDTHQQKGAPMFMSREVFHCKPGQAKELAKLFKDLAPSFKEYGVSEVRVYTDISGENYWTVVVEQEISSIDNLAEISRRTMSDPKIAGMMKGYHEFVQNGRRELYKREF
jgi:hypothetical protein